MTKIKLFIILTLSVVCFNVIAKPLDSFEYRPTQRVLDYTNTLTSEQKSTLTTQLESLKSENKVVEGFIVIVDSTEGTPINDYTNKLFRKWKLGNKDTNNGLLLVVATNDHKYRSEVGYGLEGVLNDGFLGTSMRESFRPNFKKNDFYTGISLFLISIKEKIEKESITKTDIKSNSIDETGFIDAIRNLVLLIILPVALLIIFIRKRNKQKELEIIKEMDNKVKIENMRRDNEIQKQRNREAVLASLAAGTLINETSNKNNYSNSGLASSKKNNNTTNSDYQSRSKNEDSSYNSSSDSYSSSSSSSSSYDSGGDSGGGGSSGDW